MIDIIMLGTVVLSAWSVMVFWVGYRLGRRAGHLDIEKIFNKLANHQAATEAEYPK
jgi:hypothetical protein